MRGNHLRNNDATELSWAEKHTLNSYFQIHSFQERVVFFSIFCPNDMGNFGQFEGKKCVVANRFGHFHHYSNFKLDKEIDIDIIVSFRFGILILSLAESGHKFISRNVNQIPSEI